MIDIKSFNKIIVVGSPGSGKSYISSALGRILQIPVIHLDREFWQPGWTQTPDDEWKEKQLQFVSGDKWIIDGNYGSSLEVRFRAAELVLFLDIDRKTCLLSTIKRHGKKRSDLPEYLSEKKDKEFFSFLKFIWDFPKRGKMRIKSLHELYPEKPFIVLSSRAEVNNLLEKLR